MCNTFMYRITAAHGDTSKDWLELEEFCSRLWAPNSCILLKFNFESYLSTEVYWRAIWLDYFLIDILFCKFKEKGKNAVTQHYVIETSV